MKLSRKKDLSKLFPIHERPYDNGHFVSSSQLSEILWKARRKGGQSWYCTGHTITSLDSCTVSVYDMACNVYGGVGSKLLELVVNRSSMTPQEIKLLDACILEAAKKYASEEVARRKKETFNAEVRELCKDLFGS